MICNDCLSELKPFSAELRAKFMERMAEAYFDDLFIAYEYNAQIQFMLHQLKYNGFYSMGSLLADGFEKAIEKNSADLITCVPLHKAKKRERGYNQSAGIASTLGKKFSIPFKEDVLVRTKYTSSQTKLSREERQLNVKDVFKVNEDVEGMKIILVDDVITTGATVNACALQLKQHKCKRVAVFAAATPVDILQEKLEREVSEKNSVFI